MKLKRLISALLLFAMLLSCLPLGVSATDDENSFYFSAETSKTLVVSPQKIPYSDDQTITEALTAAGIKLTIDSGSSFVTAINGVSVTTMEQLNRVKNQFTAGQTITLTIYHGGVSSDVEIILMDRANA